MAALSLAISVFLLSLSAHHVRAAPATTAALITVTDAPKEVCDDSQWHEYCSCHISTFVLPNPRQQNNNLPSKSDYFSEAAGEFSDFLPLLNSGCHEKLLTLLCFFYFPPCYQTHDKLLTIFPCKEVCLDVTDPNGECAKELQRLGSAQGRNLTWSAHEHFACENYTYKKNDENVTVYKTFDPDNAQCANHSLPYTPGATCARPTTRPSTTPKPTTPAPTTPAPTTQPPPCSQCKEEKSSKSCGSFRNALNGKTFSNNENYNFAAKVRFAGYTTHDCRSALNFTLLDQYDLKSSEDCTSAPAIPSSFLFLGEHRGCEQEFGRGEDGCFKSHLAMKKGEPLEVGETYLIAGTHELAEDNSDQFLAVDKPLITLWNKKVNNRISNAISSGNKGRCPSDS